MSNTSPAWSIAVERYISTIPLEHRHAFYSPASAEDCLILIEQAQVRNRKFNRLAFALKPLVIPLKRFECSIDVLVQTSSLFVSPVWGPLRCVLGLVSDRLSTLASVTTLLERLVEPLRRFENYERLFQENESLRVAIGALYGDLIEFCARVVGHCCKKKSLLPVMGKNSTGNFDQDVLEMSEKIRHHWNVVDTVANAAGLEEAKEARKMEERIRERELKRRVHRWLAPTPVEDDLRRLLKLYMEKSCDWILETEQFAELEQADVYRSLYVSGHPGGGKSTAASFLVQHMLSRGKDVLYFFCRTSDTERTFTGNVLRTFVFQLLQMDILLYSQVFPAFYRSGRVLLDSETEIFALFELLISKRSQPTYVILDAADECIDAPALLQALLVLPREKMAHLKVIVFGREDPALTELLLSCDQKLALQTDTTQLMRYIDQRVSKLSIHAHICDNFQQKVIENVNKASAGLWLFARLLLDEIEAAPSADEIQRQLHNLPHGLIELYTSMLKAKEGKFTETQLKMVQQLYLWLDTSDYLPSHIWSVTHGDSLDDDMINCILKFACSSTSPLFHTMKLVQDLCIPLVHTRIVHPAHIIHHCDGYAEEDSVFVAEFFHQTAKQYLKWSINAPKNTIPFSLQLRRLGPLHRGVCATWYFSESPEFQHSLRVLRDRPREGHFECFLEMACALWQSLDFAGLGGPLSWADSVEAEPLCEQICCFLKTEQCLGFLEATLALHFARRKSFVPARIFKPCPDPTAAAAQVSPSPALQRLGNVQRSLSSDVGWTICSLCLPVDNSMEKPKRFDQRPLAQKIHALGKKYQWLCIAPKAKSSNGFLASPRRI